MGSKEGDAIIGDHGVHIFRHIQFRQQCVAHDCTAVCRWSLVSVYRICSSTHISHACIFFSISGVQSSGIAYLGEFHSNRTRAKHVTFTAMFSTLSIVYMASIGWLVIPANWQIMLFGMVYRSWRLFILLSSCINVFAFIGLFLMPESPKFELAMGREESALNIIKSVYHYNTGYAKEVSE